VGARQGALLRKCCSQDKNNRPSAKALVTAFKKLNGTPQLLPGF
jgi:hypothetical protein